MLPRSKSCHSVPWHDFAFIFVWGRGKKRPIFFPRPHTKGLASRDVPLRLAVKGEPRHIKCFDDFIIVVFGLVFDPQLLVSFSASKMANSKQA